MVSFSDKTETWRLKTTKCLLKSDTLRAVDVTSLELLTRQNDMVYTKNLILTAAFMAATIWEKDLTNKALNNTDLQAATPARHFLEKS